MSSTFLRAVGKKVTPTTYTTVERKLLQIMPAPSGMRAVFWQEEGTHEVKAVHVLGLFDVTHQTRQRLGGFLQEQADRIRARTSEAATP